MQSERMARAISDLASPVWVTAVVAAVVGGLSGDWAGGIILGTLTGPVPGIGIAVLSRTGDVTSGPHVTSRDERPKVFALIAACVAVAAGYAITVGLSRPLTALLAAEAWVVAAAGFATVRLKNKPSMHTAVWFGGFLAASTLTWWGLAAVAVTPLIGWARVRVAHHTLRQVVAGAVIGASAAPVFLAMAG